MMATLDAIASVLAEAGRHCARGLIERFGIADAKTP